MTSSAILTAIAIACRWLTTGQVARKLGYHQTTIYRKCQSGSIPSTQLGDGGEYRIPSWWLEQQLEAVKPFKRR